jgi:hypothetical protein
MALPNPPRFVLKSNEKSVLRKPEFELPTYLPLSSTTYYAE